MAKKIAPFASEADLCQRFIALIGADWVAYAETQGWDILLVRNVDGFQIGIEAKLRLNGHVLSQALEERWASPDGPDCRAVLIPSGAYEAGLTKLAAYIGVTIIMLRPAASGVAEYRWPKNDEFDPKLPEPPRPGVAAWMKAVSRHLEDMRAIAFKKAGVEKP